MWEIGKRNNIMTVKKYNAVFTAQTLNCFKPNVNIN